MGHPVGRQTSIWSLWNVVFHKNYPPVCWNPLGKNVRIPVCCHFDRDFIRWMTTKHSHVVWRFPEISWVSEYPRPMGFRPIRALLKKIHFFLILLLISPKMDQAFQYKKCISDNLQLNTLHKESWVQYCIVCFCLARILTMDISQ